MAYIWTPEDYRAMASLAKKLGMNPADLLVVEYSETLPRLDPASKNPLGASGLIQITAGGIFTQEEVDRIPTLTPAEQVPFIERYFRFYQGKFNYTDAGVVYSVVFAPGRAASRGTRDDSILFSAGEGPYERNKILDHDKDGTITVGDLRRGLAELAKQPQYQRALAELQAAVPGTPPPKTSTSTSLLGNAPSGGVGLLIAAAAVGIALLASRR